jgi:hypothetical protein
VPHLWHCWLGLLSIFVLASPNLKPASSVLVLIISNNFAGNASCILQLKLWFLACAAEKVFPGLGILFRFRTLDQFLHVQILEVKETETLDQQGGQLVVKVMSLAANLNEKGRHLLVQAASTSE